ncbi:glycoside hydrolase family 6 protein [Micromonospora sp. FIMYZ51]|uniref:glycoside hydrolase family 6 protein n=1 Tax=Micromonospora sp. FIMYZ51 TaxID=3051832 RepID=UPI00311E9F4D
MPATGKTRRLLAAATVATLIGAAVVAGPARAGARAPHVDNPYAGVSGYVDPQWRARAESVPGGHRVSGHPTGIWLNRVSQIAGEPGELGLRAHLDAALAQRAGYVQVVLNNLPARDCARLAPHGEFAVGEVRRYQREFVDPIVAIERDPKYRRLRIINVVEPNAVPALATTIGLSARCADVARSGDYVEGIRYALDRLRPYANIYTYLGSGHHAELGWDENRSTGVRLITEIAAGSRAGVRGLDGVIVNTAGYGALVEPYFTVNTTVNGVSVRQTRWVDWNNFVDELPYAQRLRQDLVAAGFPEQIGVLIDTSRNGWGGPRRPTGPGVASSVDTFVDQSRVDRRTSAVNWCNQSGAGLGERPAVAPQPGVDAYVWMKPPGVSDGASDPAQAADPRSGFDPKCDPDYRPPTGSGWPPTDALRGAPPVGAWFPAHFTELMANAHPPLPAT